MEHVLTLATLAAVLGVSKLAARQVFARIGLKPHVARKASERAWHIVFGIWSFNATRMALADLGMLHNFDMGLNSRTLSCSSVGGEGGSHLLPSTLLIFYAQIALYVPNAIFHPWIHGRSEDDFWVMFAHHIIAITLCVGAVVGGWAEWGLATIITHDMADVPLDVLLVVKDLDAPNLTACLYVVTVVCWTCFRCIYYPLVVVQSALRSSSASGDAGCYAACAGLLTIFAADLFWLVKLLRVGIKELREMFQTTSPGKVD